MVTAVVAVFLVAHGLVHLAIYLAPKDPAQRVPYDPAHSWALQALHVAPAPMHTAGATLSALVATLYTCAGLALTVDASTATVVALAAAVTTLALKGLWFNTWLSLGIALDLGVLWAVTTGWPPSLL